MPTGYITILPFTLHIHHYIIHITIMTKVVAVTYEIRRVIDFLDDKALTCLHPSILCRYGYNIGLLSYLAQIIWKFRTTSIKLVIIIIIYVSVSSWWTLYWVSGYHNITRLTCKKLSVVIENWFRNCRGGRYIFASSYGLSAQGPRGSCYPVVLSFPYDIHCVLY